MLLARRYRTLEFEELTPFPRDGLIMYAVRVIVIVVAAAFFVFTCVVCLRIHYFVIRIVLCTYRAFVLFIFC